MRIDDTKAVITPNHEKHEEGWRWIPVANLEKLNQKLSQQISKAQQLGLDAPSIELGSIQLHDYPHTRGEVKYRAIEVRVIGQVKIAGWALAGRVQHGPNANVFLTVPDQSIPNKYRHTQSTLCEHCNSKRQRKDTFIVVHDDGSYKQVGSTCLADFLGHTSGEALANMLTWFTGWDTMGGLNEFDPCTMREQFVLGLEGVLRMAATIIANYGWLSTQKARDQGQCELSTRSRVSDWLMPPTDSEARKEHNKRVDKMKEVAGDVQPQVDKALEWAKAQEGSTSDYRSNLAAIAANETLTYKQLGLAVSMVQAPLWDEQQDKSKSQHIGELKERLILDVEVLSLNSYEGDYGTVVIHKMVDAVGNKLTWFCSGRPLEQGEKVTIKGTIKAHSEYKGEAETALSRVVRVD